jgi:hypothetical protein
VFVVANISDILKEGDAAVNLQILLKMKIPVKTFETTDFTDTNLTLFERTQSCKFKPSLQGCLFFFSPVGVACL